MRKLRKAIEIAIPIVGMMLVLGGILAFDQRRAQIVAAVIGLIIMEVGIWGLVRPVLPNERKYFGLRGETDRFLGLVRMLNRSALAIVERDTPRTRRRFEQIHSTMLDSVARMALLAGKTDEQLRQESPLPTRRSGDRSRPRPEADRRAPCARPFRPAVSA